MTTLAVDWTTPRALLGRADIAVRCRPNLRSREGVQVDQVLTAVQVDVLGPLRLRVNGAEHRLGGRRDRAVLALLASNDGNPLSAERLVDEVWGESAPPSATGSLQVAVSRLRGMLDPDRSSGAGSLLLQRGPSGYELHGVDLDARRFSEAANSVGSASPLQALRTADEALAAWRGRPYAELADVPSLAAEATRLVEDRLRLLESRADALLQLDRHDEAQAMLTPLVGEHPFRERLWSLLALALYRCDRQAEALETLRTLRRALVEELGVDPSASVQRLESDLLDQAPHLLGLNVGTNGGPGPTPVQVVAPAPSRPRGPSVVGRSAELAVLGGSLADLAEHDRGGVLLLTGEAGIGKSALVRELDARAREQRLRVCVGRCHEAEVAPAYWPWLPVLGALAGEDAPREVTALLGGAAEVEAVHAGAAALRTYDACARVLGGVAEPLVVVLEDMHWSDVSSLRMLTYAAEALRDRAVLFVVTVRTEASPRPALTEALAGFSRLGARRLALSPLGTDEVALLVEEVVGGAGPNLAEVLSRRSDGNPFFALEMARLLASRGELNAEAAEALVVPDGVADVLRLRFQRLDETVRETLSIAAVLGRDFDAGLIAAAAGRPVLDDLDEAMAAGVIRDGVQPGTGRFVHALARETVYADLAAGQRARRHAAVAQALAERLHRQDELVSEVAHHYSRAAVYLPDLLDAAVEHTADAARSAERRGAFEEARALWIEAVDLDVRANPPTTERRHRLLLDLAWLLMRLGDYDGMQARLRDAVRQARAEGDHVRTAEAATGFRGTSIWYWRLVSSDDPEAVETIEQCLAHVEDLGLRARLLATLGLEHYIAWRPELSEPALWESLDVARESGDPEVLRDCLAAREMTLWGPGMHLQRAECAREHLTLDLSSELRITALFQLASAQHQSGEAREADATIAKAFALAEELGRTGLDVPLAFWRWLRADETLSPDADRLADEAVELHRKSGIVAKEEVRALVRTASLRGRPVPRDLVQLASGHPYLGLRAAVAHAVAVTGDHALALEVLGPHEPIGTDYTALFGACLAVETLVLCGAAAERLEPAVEQIRPYAHQFATYGTLCSAGSTAYFVGSGLLALGRAEEATTLLERALADNLAAGCLKGEELVRRRLADVST